MVKSDYYVNAKGKPVGSYKVCEDPLFTLDVDTESNIICAGSQDGSVYQLDARKGISISRMQNSE